MKLSHREALKAGLNEALFDLIDDNVEELITRAQWNTSYIDGPPEYWTPTIEKYLRNRIIRITNDIMKGGKRV